MATSPSEPPPSNSTIPQSPPADSDPPPPAAFDPPQPSNSTMAKSLAASEAPQTNSVDSPPPPASEPPPVSEPPPPSPSPPPPVDEGSAPNSTTPSNPAPSLSPPLGSKPPSSTPYHDGKSQPSPPPSQPAPFSESPPPPSEPPASTSPQKKPPKSPPYSPRTPPSPPNSPATSSANHGPPPRPTNSTTPLPQYGQRGNPDAPAPPTENRFPDPSVIGGGVAAAVVLLFVILAILFGRRKKKRVYRSDYVVPVPHRPSPQVSDLPYSRGSSMPFGKGNSGSSTPLMPGQSYMPPDPEAGINKSTFSYEELAEFTSGFAYENLLGQGGFGCVYRGYLPDGREVAVKQLNIGGSQGEREFRAEVEIISRVHHRHLVSLVGYCVEEYHRLLVYDYVPNRTLHYHLHGRGRTIMDWPTRVKVAAGAARGLAYLHEDCHPPIIHRDIKSSNILLDNKFEAQVSDFGLAKLNAGSDTHVSTRVMGTFGYLAPEYASTGKLTNKSDVYSFGVVLLELITGQKPIDASRMMGDESLVEWARPLMAQALETGKFMGLPDPRLETNYNPSQMFRMIEAASACVRYNAPMRPQMGRVMRALDNLADDVLDLNNGVTPGQTLLFNGQGGAEQIKQLQKTALGSQDYSDEFSRSSWNQKQL